MTVVTLNGAIGAFGVEVGNRAASLLNAGYVDRLILAEAARRIGSTVEVLDIKEQRRLQLRDRMAYFFQTMLARSAMSLGAGGEPYFSPGMEYLPSEEYTDLAREPVTAAQRLDDQHFIEATSAVIKDVARGGDVVINGRGSNMILKDAPDVFHVGLIAPMDLRTRIIAKREHLEPADAGKYATDMEKARITYFRKFFKVDPYDPKLYHMVLNMAAMDVEAAAQIIAQAAVKIRATAGVKAD